MKKYLKRIVGVVMMLVLLCGQGNVYAALQEGGENGTGSGMDFSDIFLAQDISKYRSSDVYTYPKKEGYLFAGWFTDTSYKTAISKDTKTGYYFPKFVDESVLSLRLQLTENTGYNSEHTNLRFITSVDNLKYASIGFIVNGTEKISNTVYQTIKGYTKDGTSSYEPDDVFHTSSNYFATYSLRNAQNEIGNHGIGDNFGATVNVVPQWTTLDGTTVTGAKVSFEINDFLYESELQGSSHLWGTLADNLNSASASTVNATIDMLDDAEITAETSCAANLSAGDLVTVTVNGNDKTVTTTGNSDIFAVESDIAWKNITISHGGSASLFTLNDSCDFTLNQVNITGTSANAAAEAAIITTGEHCDTAHVVETITEGQRTVSEEVDINQPLTDTYYVTTEGLLANEQDKTVNISILDSSIDAKSSSKTAGIRVMRGTIAHINLTDSAIDTKDTRPVYVTGADSNYPTWRGMAYITADSASTFSQNGTAVTTADIKEQNGGIVALQEYTNRVIILADTHYMPEEDQENDYSFEDDAQGFSLGHTQADRMKNILLDIEFFQNRQKVDSVLVLGDLGNDNYPLNKIGVNADGTFSDITANYVYKFKNEVMSKFQSQWGISSWALAGNHDSYLNEQWKQIMGYDRQYAKEIGDAVFVMLDTYVPKSTDVGSLSGSTYSGIDVDWLKEQLDANTSWKGKPIFLSCHYYQYNEYKSDGTENKRYNAENTVAFQEVLATYEAKGYKFVSMFMGHVHSTYHSTKHYIDCTSDNPKIPMMMLGGYAYSVGDYDLFATGSAWGFGVLEWNENEAHYYHVKYDRTYVSTEDGTTDTTVSYKGAIENEMFLTY